MLKNLKTVSTQSLQVLGLFVLGCTSQAFADVPETISTSVDINSPQLTLTAVVEDAGGSLANANSCYFAVRNEGTGEWYNFDTDSFSAEWFQVQPPQMNTNSSSAECSITTTANFNEFNLGTYRFYYRGVDSLNFLETYNSVPFETAMDSEKPISSLRVVEVVYDEEFELTELLVVGETFDNVPYEIDYDNIETNMDIQIAVFDPATNSWFNTANNSFLPANTFHYTFMSFAEGDGSAIEPYEWATGFSQQTGFSEFNFTLVPQAYYILFYRAIDGSGNFEDWNQFVFNSGFGQNQVDNPGGGGPGDDCPPGEDCEL